METVTLRDLMSYKVMKTEIETMKALAQQYRDQALSITQQYSDVPGAHNASDKIGKLVSIYMDLEEKALEREEKAAAEIQRIERFIACIPDSITRQVFILRFEMGMDWKNVAAETGNSEEGAKKRCYRYIAQHQ